MPGRQRCTQCYVEFNTEDLPLDCAACPNCGDKGLPCDTDQDVNITINWHELHILCVWAERWAHRASEDPTSTAKPGTIYSIAERIEAQARKEGYPALTLARTINELPGDLKKHGINVKIVDHNIPGADKPPPSNS